jgi:hypothetical protein
MSGEHDHEPTTDPGGSGFRWHTIEAHRSTGEHGGASRDDGEDDRRVGYFALAALILAATSGLVLLSAPIQAHTSFTANDVAVTGNSGQLKSLSIAPEGDVHYSGLEAEPSAVEVTVSAKLGSASTWETVGTTTVSATGLEGAVNYSFARADLLKSTSLKKPDFRASDGATESTDVDVRVHATIVGGGPNGSNVTTAATDTMSVSVTNLPAGGRVGGTANSNGVPV